MMRGHFSEAQRWMEHVLAHHPPEPSLARAQALFTASVLAYAQADYARAARLAEACVGQYRALGDAAGMAMGISTVGLIAVGLEQYDRALPLLEEGVARYVGVGNTWGAAMVMTYWVPLVLQQRASARAGQCRPIGPRSAELGTVDGGPPRGVLCTLRLGVGGTGRGRSSSGGAAVSGRLGTRGGTR